MAIITKCFTYLSLRSSSQGECLKVDVKGGGVSGSKNTTECYSRAREALTRQRASWDDCDEVTSSMIDECSCFVLRWSIVFHYTPYCVARRAIYASAMRRGRSGTDHRAPLIYADNYRQILLLSRSSTNWMPSRSLALQVPSRRTESAAWLAGTIGLFRMAFTEVAEASSFGGRVDAGQRSP